MTAIIEVPPAKFVGGTFRPGVKIRKRRDHDKNTLWIGSVYAGNSYRVTELWVHPKTGDTWLKLAEGGWCGFLIKDGVYGGLKSEWR